MINCSNEALLSWEGGKQFSLWISSKSEKFQMNIYKNVYRCLERKKTGFNLITVNYKLWYEKADYV